MQDEMLCIQIFGKKSYFGKADKKIKKLKIENSQSNLIYVQHIFSKSMQFKMLDGQEQATDNKNKPIKKVIIKLHKERIIKKEVLFLVSTYRLH